MLPASLLVGEDGVVTTNTLPVITADRSGDLGILTSSFDVEYSVNDAEGDTIAVTESFDGVDGRSYEAVPDQTETYSLNGEEWLKVTNV